MSLVDKNIQSPKLVRRNAMHPDTPSTIQSAFGILGLPNSTNPEPQMKPTLGGKHMESPNSEPQKKFTFGGCFGLGLPNSTNPEPQKKLTLGGCLGFGCLTCEKHMKSPFTIQHPFDSGLANSTNQTPFVSPDYKSSPLKHRLDDDDENENVKRIKNSLLEMNEIIKIHKNIVKQTTVITKDNIQITFDIKENGSTIQHNYIYNY